MKSGAILALLLSLAVAVQGSPIVKRDAYQITSPAANSTWYTNQELVVTWTQPPDNSPINIGLVAGADQPLSANSIVVSEGLSGSIGTVIVPLDASFANGTTAWRIAIAHGSDPVVYSGAFTISNDIAHEPQTTATISNASYSAVASISILGPDGKPLTFAQNGAASSVATFAASYLLFPALIMTYILL